MYWKIIPYEYRPRQLWYKLRGLLWDRHHVVKCRYLECTWQDKVEVLPHAMFEVLSEFIEEECSPGIVDWEASAHTVEINGKKVNVRSEMQYLYDWWHTYRLTYSQVDDILWGKVHAIMKRAENPDAFINLKFANAEDAELYQTYLHACINLDELYEKDLSEKMHRLVNLRRYLWT